jgi:uncharacterized protein (DUF169 family)
MTLSVIREFGNIIEKYLKLKTSVLAVKLLQNKEDIPTTSKRPKKDFGYHLSLCQTLAISRREGTFFTMLKEDMWCFYPVIGLGLAEAPKYFIEGNNRFPGNARTLKAGKKWAQSFPHFKLDKYMGITFAPLSKTTFNPDLIILYCDPTQLSQILKAVIWIDGNDINCKLPGDAGCVYTIVPTIQNNQFQVTVPCMGDRMRALAKDDELIFSFPINKLKNFAEGVESLEKNNYGLLVKYQQTPEYKLKESYIKIGNLMGMNLEK